MRSGLMAIWVMCFLVMGISSAAQVYQTQAGTILASGRYKGAGVTGVSNHLIMQLNYESAAIQLRLMISSLLTKNDSLNGLLQKLAGQELIFNGKMNIAFVQTNSHPKQKFKTEGMLYLNSLNKPFSFSCVLQHFPIGNTSCILSGEFIIDLKQFNIDNLSPGEEKIAVKFSQLVLKKSGE